MTQWREGAMGRGLTQRRGGAEVRRGEGTFANFSADKSELQDGRGWGIMKAALPLMI